MERLTQRARRVLSLAHHEAERLRHNYIGTEHLLLGLIREEGGVAARVLRELGLEAARVEEIVERLSRLPFFSLLLKNDGFKKEVRKGRK